MPSLCHCSPALLPSLALPPCLYFSQTYLSIDSLPRHSPRSAGLTIDDEGEDVPELGEDGCVPRLVTHAPKQRGAAVQAVRHGSNAP